MFNVCFLFVWVFWGVGGLAFYYFYYTFKMSLPFDYWLVFVDVALLVIWRSWYVCIFLAGGINMELFCGIFLLNYHLCNYILLRQHSNAHQILVIIFYGSVIFDCCILPSDVGFIMCVPSCGTHFWRPQWTLVLEGRGSNCTNLQRETILRRCGPNTLVWVFLIQHVPSTSLYHCATLPIKKTNIKP